MVGGARAGSQNAWGWADGTIPLRSGRVQPRARACWLGRTARLDSSVVSVLDFQCSLTLVSQGLRRRGCLREKTARSTIAGGSRGRCRLDLVYIYATPRLFNSSRSSPSAGCPCWSVAPGRLGGSRGFAWSWSRAATAVVTTPRPGITCSNPCGGEEPPSRRSALGLLGSLLVSSVCWSGCRWSCACCRLPCCWCRRSWLRFDHSARRRYCLALLLCPLCGSGATDDAVMVGSRLQEI